MGTLSATQRPALLQQLSSQPVDLLVIGGGATGAGIALDAASRGMSVALLEKNDFAFGTSSRSTKLIHGGLRYLKQLDIKVVHEVGQERATVHRLAPHLVVSEAMLLPLIQGGSYGKWATSFGLWMYDLLAGVSGSDRRKMLSRAATRQREPLLREDLLLGSGRYAEYRTDDARLTIENVKKAVEHGALAANYVKVNHFTYDAQGQINGVEAEDLFGGNALRVAARLVVNAAGPWVDELRKENQSLDNKRLFLSKGVHIVVPHERFPIQQSVYFDVADGRMIFAIPRGKITYIGTTDTEYSGNKERPRTNLEDVLYLLNATNYLFPSVKLTLEDVESSWAGLRPLIYEEGKSASEISRKDEIFVSRSGLVSIAGGKLTGYRKMAEKVVNFAAKRLQAATGKRFKPCQTRSIPLVDGQLTSAQAVAVYRSNLQAELAKFNFDEYNASNLVHLYGAQSGEILQRFQQGGDWSETGLVLAELDFCLENEMVHKAVDFFIRRSGRLYFDVHSVKKYAPAAIEHMAARLGWSEQHAREELSLLWQELEWVTNFPTEPVSAI